jgi:hypothetical protein
VSLFRITAAVEASERETLPMQPVFHRNTIPNSEVGRYDPATLALKFLSRSAFVLLEVA